MSEDKVIWLNGSGVRSAKGGFDFSYEIIMKNIDIRTSTYQRGNLVRINMETEDILLMKEAIEKELKKSESKYKTYTDPSIEEESEGKE